MDKDREMLDGYEAGYVGHVSEEEARRRSVAFYHGWKCGRDDREGQPRERLQVVQARTQIILDRGRRGV